MEEAVLEEEEEEGGWEATALPMDTWPLLQNRTGLVYDEKMMSHCNLWDKCVLRGLGWVVFGSLSSVTKPLALLLHTVSHHPETPQRILRIMCHLEEVGLAARCLILPARPALDSELLTCHRSDPVLGGGRL